MRIIYDTLGNFVPSDFDLTPIVANEFIPLFAFQTQRFINDIAYYSKPSFQRQSVRTKPNTLKNIRDGFEMAHTTREININGRNFFIVKGAFFSKTGVPLMVCAMKRRAFLDSSIENYESNSPSFSYSNYVLFYSTSFFTDPGLTPLNRRLQKEILQSCYEKGIEVRMLSSLEIEKNTFARLFEVKKTKSLTQLEAYMNQVLPNFLYNGGEDTFVEQEFEPVTYVPEELPLEQEALLYDSQPTMVEVPWEIPAQTIEEARELAELVLEAAEYDSESLEDQEWDEEDIYDEQEEDREEMEIHEERTREIESTHIELETPVINLRSSLFSSTPVASIELIDDTE
jgi:hypothetical protein